ncbi:MAG: NAD(P)H-hydrate epimerase [Nitrososphaerota archaeon]|nr:NAD(P)H-hydrate epimerase [Nitrososphaerota archaeon]MDG6922947.1 NAD(P)H-hydrate epimerase [Nitrososphaerota archaeon]
MMESAGGAIARFVASSFDKELNVLLVAGVGNNGGDAFVAARHLTFYNEVKVTLALIGKESDVRQEESLANWSILKRIQGIRVMEIDSIEKIEVLETELSKSDVVISAIFGTGFKGSPRTLHAKVIEVLNTSDATTISIDIPSGMEADSGNFEISVQSDYTITMDSPKTGMFATEKSRKACGEILVANIGLPK